jgi:hypothetical protein
MTIKKRPAGSPAGRFCCSEFFERSALLQSTFPQHIDGVDFQLVVQRFNVAEMFDLPHTHQQWNDVGTRRQKLGGEPARGEPPNNFTIVFLVAAGEFDGMPT